MKRIFLVVLLLLLIISSIIINDKRYDRTFPGDFRQFGYNSLVEAENKLKQKQYYKALLCFKKSVTVASRCNRIDILKRIKARIANTGFETMKNTFPEGFRFLEFYVLTSDDFESTATIVEDFCLTNALGDNTFSYSILDSMSQRTIWGTRFIREPAMVYVLLKNSFKVNYESKEASNIPLKNYSYETLMAKIRLMSPKGIKERRIVISGMRKGQQIFFINERGIIDFSWCNQVENAEDLCLLIKEEKRYFVIDKISIVGRMPCKVDGMAIKIVRIYDPL